MFQPPASAQRYSALAFAPLLQPQAQNDHMWGLLRNPSMPPLPNSHNICRKRSDAVVIAWQVCSKMILCTILKRLCDCMHHVGVRGYACVMLVVAAMLSQFLTPAIIFLPV